MGAVSKCLAIMARAFREFVETQGMVTIKGSRRPPAMERERLHS